MRSSGSRNAVKLLKQGWGQPDRRLPESAHTDPEQPLAKQYIVGDVPELDA